MQVSLEWLFLWTKWQSFNFFKHSFSTGSHSPTPLMHTHLYLILTFKASVIPGIRISSPSGWEQGTLEPLRLRACRVQDTWRRTKIPINRFIFISPFPEGRSYLPSRLVGRRLDCAARSLRSEAARFLKRPSETLVDALSSSAPLFDVCPKLLETKRSSLERA